MYDKLIEMSNRGRLVCKARLEQKREYEYCIAPLENLSYVVVIGASTLKAFLSTHRDAVINLRLTTDNRIFFSRFRYDNKYSIRNIKLTKKSSYIKVRDLIPGHIVNQKVFRRSHKKMGRDISPINNNRGLIVGAGYILNDTKIESIKRHYDLDCTINIMDAFEVRNEIIVNKDFRYRLAVFYAKEMRDTKYLHTSNIKSKLALRIYDIIRRNVMTDKFLVQDPNLLMIMFILYGYHMYTFEHSVDVAIYACMIYAIIYKENIKTEDLTDLFLCGLVHDIGKIAIPVDVIDKPGRYKKEELALMNQHPTNSMKIISQLCQCDSSIFIRYKNNPSRAERIINGAHYHHRFVRNTGGRSGYPADINVFLDEEENGWFYRIIKAADMLDGMRSPRPYRAKKGVKPKENQREYLGIVSIVEDKMSKSVENGELNEIELNAIREMMYVDEKHDADDDYGVKITNVLFNESIINNYQDITKYESYKE